MKLQFLKLCLCAAALPATGAAETREDAPARTGQLTRAGEQSSVDGPVEYFTGRVRIDPVWPADQDINASGGLVTFEPGARSAWHTHPAGQRLVVMSGVGLTQEWGKPVQVIRPGDVVWCPPGVKHWHGAASNVAMTHLAVTGTVDGKNVVWMEKVTDEQYRAPRASEALSARQQAIVPIAALAAAGDMARLAVALNQGLDVGLTISEAKEILVQLYAYAGFPRSLNGLGELMKVLEERKQRGIRDEPGRGPGRGIPKGDALLAAGTANQTKLSGGPVAGPLFDFAPAIDEYLKTHLFGDVFERDNLDWQSRELATVSMLSALSGLEPQLQAHMRISMNVGLTAAQLRELTWVLGDQVGAEAAGLASAALERQLAARPVS